MHSRYTATQMLTFMDELFTPCNEDRRPNAQGVLQPYFYVSECALIAPPSEIFGNGVEVERFRDMMSYFITFADELFVTNFSQKRYWMFPLLVGSAENSHWTVL